MPTNWVPVLYHSITEQKFWTIWHNFLKTILFNKVTTVMIILLWKQKTQHILIWSSSQKQSYFRKKKKEKESQTNFNFFGSSTGSLGLQKTTVLRKPLPWLRAEAFVSGVLVYRETCLLFVPLSLYLERFISSIYNGDFSNPERFAHLIHIFARAYRAFSLPLRLWY